MSVEPQFPPERIEDHPHRRVVFSHNTSGLQHQRVLSTQTLLQASHRRLRNRSDDSLFRILNDLNDRPIDPIYQDAVITASTRHHGKTVTIFLRIIIVVICAAIGFGGVAVVEQLHANSRRRVRMELANQVSRTTSREDKLKEEVDRLERQVQSESARVPVQKKKTDSSEELMNGTTAVRGKGISITIDQVSNKSSHSSRTGIAAPATLMDSDLQQLTNILWAHDAEAISINNQRIGMTTSIRTAGSSILIGLTSLNAPYVLRAIGDPVQLMNAMNSSDGKNWRQSVSSRGLTVSVATDNAITMNPVAGSLKSEFAHSPNSHGSGRSQAEKN
jgi:uncharacterized protein YlxW (UPF0749 family)